MVKVHDALDSKVDSQWNSLTFYSSILINSSSPIFNIYESSFRFDSAKWDNYMELRIGLTAGFNPIFKAVFNFSLSAPFPPIRSSYFCAVELSST